MEPVRNGSREFVPLDQLHLENLYATFPEFSHAADFEDSELADLNAGVGAAGPVGGQRGRPGRTRPTCDRRTAVERQPCTATADGAAGETALDRDHWFDATRAYKPTMEAYRNMARILRLDPGEVMLVAAHNRDLTFAQRAGLGTAFIPRPTEFGAATGDLAAEGDWDINCVSTDLGSRSPMCLKPARFAPSRDAS